MERATRSSAGAPEVLSLRMSWSPSLAGLGGEVSPGAGIKRFSKTNLLAALAGKKAFALINFICVISSAINSTWHEEKSGKFHSNHE